MKAKNEEKKESNPGNALDEQIDINLKPTLMDPPNNHSFDKSNDPEKSDFHTEQIDSPSTSKNLDNIDRDSEEWEGISNQIVKSKKNHSPEITKGKGSKLEGKCHSN